LFAQYDALKRRLWREDDVFEALAVGGEDDFAAHPVFAVGTVIVINGLNRERLRIRVIAALDFEFGFSVRKALDDLVDGNGRRFIGNGIVPG
jgi:hypothetical protein